MKKNVVGWLARVVSMAMAIAVLRKLYNIGIGGYIIVVALCLVWSTIAYIED